MSTGSTHDLDDIDELEDWDQDEHDEGTQVTIAPFVPSDLCYEDFLREKVNFDKSFGFKIDPSEVNLMLFPHQRDMVVWGVAGGRRAYFAAFGLGKTFIQIETLRLVTKHKGGASLIVAPLGMRHEFILDGAKLGVEVQFIQTLAFGLPSTGMFVTNYESVREGKIDPTKFTATSLDEASVLRDYGSKTFQTFLHLFKDVAFRYVATATPSPNRYKELIHYAAYLGIMDSGQALTRFFQRDSSSAGNLTIHPHKQREFWLWLSTWACFIQKPSDLGYSDEGYNLPELVVRFHNVTVKDAVAPVDKDGQAQLFRAMQLGLAEAANEKRISLPHRVAKLAEIVKASPEDHFVLWHNLEDERRAIKTAVPEATEVFGSLDLDERERRVVAFSDGELRLLATKPSISGSGSNFQRHCHRAIFAGIDFKFNDWIQSIHRLHRFQQTEQVEIDVILAESEAWVAEVLMQKWEQYKVLTAAMSDVLREFGLDAAAISSELSRSMGVERVEVTGNGWMVVNNDCVLETRDHMASDSIEMILTSIPFGNQYEYSPSYNDFGHTDNTAHFLEQMDYLSPNLFRVLKPGRVMAIHVKDRIRFGNVEGTGNPTVEPFHAKVIEHYMSHGFDYLGMHTIVTDVVRENNQTYRLGYTKMRKDASSMGMGMPEYVLLFRKPQTDRTKGWADVRVEKDVEDYSLARWQIDAHAFWRSSGNRHLTPEELGQLKPEDMSRLFTEQTKHEVYNYESHVKTGEILAAKHRLPSTFMSLAPASWHPDVWHDVNRMLTLNGEQSRRNLTMHICPLQFDIVDRLIEEKTNKGDLIYDPFAGLSTVSVRAQKLGRRGYGAELNPESFLDGVKYLEAGSRKKDMPTLFDVLDLASESGDAA
jgi:hypothetical protein